jgi:hypothetical protein
MFGSLIYGFDKALDKLSRVRGSVKWPYRYQGGCDTNKEAFMTSQGMLGSPFAWK